MKKYIRCHVVEAKPCTLGEWEQETGRTWNEPDRSRTEEGYKCDYPDGYSGWCPKAEFEKVSRPIDNMTFGMAIEAMKQGKKVARAGWNGKGMWLCIPLVEGPKEIPSTGIWGKPNVEYAEQNGGTVKVMPYITMKAADGSIVMGWLASQTDMLADDWVIVE